MSKCPRWDFDRLVDPSKCLRADRSFSAALNRETLGICWLDFGGSIKTGPGDHVGIVNLNRAIINAGYGAKDEAEFDAEKGA
jgi:hypothetical protein